MSSLCIGTSGWSYAHWKGPFYPEALADEDMLAHYARRFGSVELNNTFYQLPEQAAIARWCDAVPADFVFSVKASRYITHMKRLREPDRTLPPFMQRIRGFGARLGPVLLQLPPRWRRNLERLEAFLERLDTGHRYAFEFRDPDWFGRETWRLLERYGAAACIYDLDGVLSPRVATAEFVYIRLHGPDGPYRGSYDTRALAGWAGACSSWLRAGRDVYCYFDNDDSAYAALDALRLRRMLEKTWQVAGVHPGPDSEGGPTTAR